MFNHRKPGSGILLSAVALVFVFGCSETQRRDWNAFWGVGGSEQKPVARRGRSATPPERDSRLTRDEGQGQRSAPSAEGRPTKVERDIDAYVRRVPPSEDSGYEPNDHLAKIRRQQDSRRGEPTRSTADAQRSRADSEALAAGDPRASDFGGGRRRNPIVRTASDSAGKSPGIDPRLPNTRNAGAADRSPRITPPESVTRPGETGANTPAVTRLPSNETATPFPQDSAPGEPSGAAASNSIAGEPGATGSNDAAPELADIKISAGQEPEPKAEKDSSLPAPNRPVETPAAVDTFNRRLRELTAQVEKDPNNIEEQYRLRMMHLIDGADEKALAPIAGGDADMQDIVLAQIRTLIAARSSSGRDPATWANRQLDSIEDLRRRMRARADLQVPKVVLCTAIDGFGRYEPIDPTEFPAGRNNLVLIYIEVDNFSSERTASGLYRTLLSVRQTLLNKAGEQLWSKRDENIEDLARQQRRDFYLTIGPIAIPKTLGPGEYVLKVEVEDVLAGKLNSDVATFKLVP